MSSIRKGLKFVKLFGSWSRERVLDWMNIFWWIRCERLTMLKSLLRVNTGCWSTIVKHDSTRSCWWVITWLRTYWRSILLMVCSCYGYDVSSPTSTSSCLPLAYQVNHVYRCVCVCVGELDARPPPLRSDFGVSKRRLVAWNECQVVVMFLGSMFPDMADDQNLLRMVRTLDNGYIEYYVWSGWRRIDYRWAQKCLVVETLQTETLKILGALTSPTRDFRPFSSTTNYHSSAHAPSLYGHHWFSTISQLGNPVTHGSEWLLWTGWQA